MSDYSLDTTVSDPPLTLDTADAQPLSVDPAVAADRVFKLNTGLPKLGLTTDDMFRQIVSGQERSLREFAASHANEQKELFKQQAITKLTLDKGTSLTKEDLGYLDKLLAAKPTTDPASVIEEYYPAEFLDRLHRSGVINNPDWKRADPIDVKNEIYKGRELFARTEYMRTRLQDTNNLYANQTGLGWAADRAKEMIIPLYSDIKLRANIEGTGYLSGILRGTNLEEQAKELAASPTYDIFKQKFNTALSRLEKDNPGLALQWGQAMLGMSSSQRFMENLLGAVDAGAGFATIGLAGKAAYGFGKATKELIEVRKAIRSTVGEGVRTPAPSEAAISEAVGDTRASAVKAITDTIIKEAETKGTPISESMKSLAGIFNETVDNMTSAVPTNVSRELINRLGEGWATTKSQAISGIRNGIKVEHLTVLQAVEEEVTKLEQALSKKYPGMDNRVLNSKLRYDPEANVYWIDHFLGDEGGVVFKEKGTAERFAEIHNLPGRQIVGRDFSEAASNKPKPGYTRYYYGGPEAPHQSPTVAYASKMYNVAKGQHPSGNVWYIDIPTKGGFYPSNVSKVLNALRSKKPNELGVFPRALLEQFKPYSEGVGKETTIVQNKGRGYVVTVSKPLDHTQPLVRQILMATEETKTPTSWLNGFFHNIIKGGPRTPEEVLSVAQRENRKAATFGQALFHEIAWQAAKDIRELRGWSLPGSARKQKWEEWKTVVKMTQDMKDADGHRIYLDNINQLNELYMRRHNRLPDDQEIMAYFNGYKKIEELRKVWLNFQRNQADHRRGAEEHTIKDVIDSSRATANAAPLKGAKFEATTLPSLPKDGHTTVIVGESTAKTRVRTSSGISNKFTEALDKDIASGKRVVLELTHPEEFPFLSWMPAGYEKARPRYVVVENKNLESKPLPWDLNKAVGGANYDYEHYVGQARLTKDPVSGFHWYDGDSTIAAFNIGTMARDVAKHLDDIRKLLKEGKIAEAEDLHRGNLPMDFDTVRGWFENDMGAPGVRPRLDINEPIQVVQRNKTLIESDKSLLNRKGLIDAATENAQRYGTGEKYDPHDIFTLRNDGTRTNPLYSVVPVEHLDPMVSMNRSLSKVINSALLNDYKVFSVEHWIQEAKPYLRASDKELADSPFFHFFNPKYIEAPKPEDLTRIKNLDAVNYQIRQFVGIKDSMDTFLHSTAQKLVDSIYEKGGAKYALTPSHLLPYLRDPFGFVRSLAFDATLGLFAVPQLMVQLQTFSTILGIAGPGFAAPGAKAMLLHQWSRYNEHPEIIAHLDKLASTKIIPGTHGFRPGWFTEARDLLIRSGFDTVGVEHSLRNLLERSVTSSATGDILNWGRVFFREGERAGRMGAFYTSYLEHRIANPVGALGQRELRQILERADVLSGNMSRASVSGIQQGFLSIPTQFLTYQIRLAELFLGKRLSVAEKTRLFGTYSLLYGIPSATGLSGLPLGDYLRKDAVENGYNVGEKWVDSTVMEGIPAMLMALSTGAVGGNAHWYNVAERYSVGSGIEPAKDLLRGDKSFLEILGGASYSKLKNTISSMDSFYAFAMSHFSSDGQIYKLKFEHFLAPFQELSTVNNAYKMIMALNTGKWLAKNGQNLGEISPGNAIFNFVSGLQPRAFTDIYNESWYRDTEKELQKEGLKRYIREMRHAFDALNSDTVNTEQVKEYMANAEAFLIQSGYPREKWPQALSQAAESYKPLLSTSKWDYLTKDVPAYRKQKAMESIPSALKSISPYVK